MARIPPSAEDMKLSNALIRRRKKVYGEDFTPSPDEMRLVDALNLVRQKMYGSSFIDHPSNREVDILNELGESHPEYAVFRARQQERDVQIKKARRWIGLNIKNIKGLGKRRVVDSNELAQAMEEAFSQNCQSDSRKYEDSTQESSSAKISQQKESVSPRAGIGGRKPIYNKINIHMVLASIVEVKTFEWFSSPKNIGAIELMVRQRITKTPLPRTTRLREIIRDWIAGKSGTPVNR